MLFPYFTTHILLLRMYLFPFFFHFNIEVLLIYSVVLISAVQESDSGVHIHPFLDPFLIYIITEYQGEFPLLNAIE